MVILMIGIKPLFFHFHEIQQRTKGGEKAIPRDNIPESPDTVVCRRHWPANYEFTIVRGKIRPINPPSIFKELPPSLLPTPPSKPRPTSAACPTSRNVLPDEHNAFQKADVIKTFGELQNKLVDNKHDFSRFSIFSYLLNDCLIIQSVEFEQPSCIPRFLLKIFYDFTYSALLWYDDSIII